MRYDRSHSLTGAAIITGEWDTALMREQIHTKALSICSKIAHPMSCQELNLEDDNIFTYHNIITFFRTPTLRSESVPYQGVWVASYCEAHPLFELINVTKSCCATSGKWLQGLSIITLTIHGYNTGFPSLTTFTQKHATSSGTMNLDIAWTTRLH
jgi:hypothetical protein